MFRYKGTHFDGEKCFKYFQFFLFYQQSVGFLVQHAWQSNRYG